jgi:murein DD-endopeptidase MepM/ murein hydrolase activator NlpD
MAGARSTALPVARRDTIRKGEEVVAVLVRAGLPTETAKAVLDASETRSTARRDIPVSLFSDSAAAPVREVEFQIADDRSIRVIRIGESQWSATERRELWRADTVAIRAAFVGTLVESMRTAGRGALGIRARTEVAYSLAEAFEYKLDVSRDLERGDSVVAVVERRRTAFGAEQVGPLLGGSILHDAVWQVAIRFTTPKGTSEYYDLDGKPMRTTFLAAPLEYRRMSSAFGMRLHPILGIFRRHPGVDFAAPTGTPVRAVGDGAVVKAGFGGGYGRVIEIRHRDGMITRYGHLRGFAAGLREGQVVGQGQVIGFVGSTGLSTGPHLHFETLVNGESKDPTRTLRNASGVVLNGEARLEFARVRDGLAGRLALPRKVPLTAPAAATQAVPATSAAQPAAVVGTPK